MKVAVKVVRQLGRSPMLQRLNLRSPRGELSKPLKRGHDQGMVEETSPIAPYFDRRIDVTSGLLSGLRSTSGK